MNSAVKKRADEKLKEAYELCYLPLIKYCNVRMGDANATSDDCVQEAFLVYYNRLLSGEEFENPRAFLYRTADNFVKRAVESYGNQLKRTLPLDEAEIVESWDLPFNIENTDFDALAQKLICTLTEQEKEFYKLKYIDKLSLAEIAQKLSISPVAAAKRSSRLRKQIIDKLNDFIDNECEGGI